MRKILTSIIILCALIGGMTANAQFRYGPTVGADITTLKFKQNLIGVGQSVGFSAGVQGELMFPGIGFGIDIGLRYEHLKGTVSSAPICIISTFLSICVSSTPVSTASRTLSHHLYMPARRSVF